jgi:hypothetical protein
LLSLEVGYVWRFGYGRQLHKAVGRFLRGGDGTIADTAMRLEVFAEVSADLNTEVIALAEGLVADYDAISSGTISRMCHAVWDYHFVFDMPMPLAHTVHCILDRRRVEVSAIALHCIALHPIMHLTVCVFCVFLLYRRTDD